ncbi:unnamed protein product [Orchesella dallaii]|uniref:Receptor ligand binding region domain-containing protein n=1 Tax=Orchesella dallaii TaxID=48710 RepID=A0ABP1RRA3_9HEXA
MSVSHCSRRVAQAFFLKMVIFLTLIWSPSVTEDSSTLGATFSTPTTLGNGGEVGGKFTFSPESHSSHSPTAGRSLRSPVSSPFHGGGLGGTRSSSSFPSQQQPPPPPIYSDQLPTTLVRLEVVAILGDLSKPYVALSKTLARTLNSVTAADLVSQLDFPEKNLTWRVRNFFVNDQPQQLPTALHQVETGSSGGSGYGSDDSLLDGEEFVDDYYVADDHDEGRTSGSGSGSGAGSGGRKRPRRPKVLFGPMVMPKLCEFLSETRAVAIVNLIGDVSSERLLSLVATSTGIPLIGSSTYASPLTLHEDKEDLYVSLSASVRHFARALGHLLVYCHWHSFSVLFDDSPSTINTQGAWEEVLSQMTTRLRDKSIINAESSKSSSSVNLTDYDYDDEDGGSPFDDDYPDPILHPNYLTIKTRDSLSAFRALSELTKATQGVIVLLCSERSTMQVFHAAKRLRMLNGDYVFILVGQFNEFESAPDWIPSGVLALRSPRKAPIGKSLMKTTGKLLASAVTTIKDEPAPVLPPSPGNNNGNGENGGGNGNNGGGEYYNGGMPSGGVFSGFTKSDLNRMGPIKLTPGGSGSLGLNPFLLPPGSGNRLPNDNKSTRLMTSAVDTSSRSSSESPAELPPPQTILGLLENLSNISCWQQPPDYWNRKIVSMAITR